MSIKVENIAKNYGKQKALNDVSFEINAGEVVGFLGPNGAGKSTMMKIICGYITQTAGAVEVCGINTIENAINARTKIGYLPEHNPLYLDMYIKEFLSFISDIHKIKNKKERIEEMIQLTGLTPEMHKKIGELSKGYRQRVGIASALIHDPEVLILDEPTTGLDPNQLKDIRNLIKNIGKSKTVMLSTHIMQEVEAICDRVIIIKDGVIVTDEPIEKLKNNNNLQVLEVEFQKEFESSHFNAIKNIVAVSSLSPTLFAIQYSAENDVRAEVSQLAIHKDNIVLSMQLKENKLEEIFQSLTKE